MSDAVPCCLVTPHGVHLEPWMLGAALVVAVALFAIIVITTRR